MIKGLEQLSGEERPRELELLSLEKRRHRGVTQNLINASKYLKRGCNGDGARLCSVVPQWQDRRQWAQTGTPEVLSEHQEALLCCAGDGALAQVAPRGCGVSLDILKSCHDVVLGNLL